MRKRTLAVAALLLCMVQAQAQLGVMKRVGNNTQDYALGFGAFIKSAIPVSEGADVTVELGANLFPLKGYGMKYGTIMCPLKAGYRYTLNGTGQGFYVEPQAGFNLFGLTSLPEEYGNNINLRYHGAVLAAGAGFLFTIGRAPFDLNLRYEMVIAQGGSNNLISLGISRTISFGKKDTDY
ncbi:MAG TPA: autotransporter outer membrane beta-barrel domain-containing protein [Flavisolibacter sp.]|nr:autotransporter outer membrane beta-barrel domain-containing protein [Flavisolibacter sp.]